MGTPEYLAAQGNFKQLCYYLCTAGIRCYLDSHRTTESKGTRKITETKYSEASTVFLSFTYAKVPSKNVLPNSRTT